MAQQWCNVRIRPETRADLLRLAKLWEEGGLARDWAPSPFGMHVSVDAVVAELIRRDAEHRQRAGRQQAGRRFHTAWMALARRGACDDRGGAEYRRVLDAWFAAGMPTNVGDFILDHAHRPA